MRKPIVPLLAALGLLLGSSGAADAQITSCPADPPNECITTTECVPDQTTYIEVQLGGLGAKDSNEGDIDPPADLDDGTLAYALIGFEKTTDTTLEVTLRNCTLTKASLTAAYFMLTPTVSGIGAFDGDCTDTSCDITPDPQLTTWQVEFENACEVINNGGIDNPDRQNCGSGSDRTGIRADGFGRFDAAIGNGGNSAEQPNGGDPEEIEVGDNALTFEITIPGGFNICDILDELSEVPPGDRLVNVVGRFQSGEQGGSGFIGPCDEDTTLLAILSDFHLSPDDNTMDVAWSTSLEIDNAGFNVLRREATRGGWQRINAELIPGQGDTVTGFSYGFLDETALNGVEYVYRIEDIDFNGKNDLSHIQRAVPNPPNPRLKLTQPAYGASVDLRGRPSFSYEGDVRGGLIMQVSADPSFEPASTLTTRVPRRGFGNSDFTLDRRSTRLMTAMAETAGGILYWRLVGRDLVPVSDTFRLEVSQ